MKLSQLVCASLLIVPAAGCIDTANTSDTEGDSSSTTYVNVTDTDSADGLYDLQGKLAAEFAETCGDTFCEGEYSNLTPLGLQCSVTSKRGDIHDCAWTFGASQFLVNPTAATLEINAPTFTCHFAPKTSTTAAKLFALLDGADSAIDTVLPGSSTSIYDSLVDCFQHPDGATPISIVATPTPTYVAASDYYVSAAGKAKWAAAQKALLDGFNNVCGDTFCGSDYGDLQSLGFECSITKSTGNIKSCAWVFAGNFAEPDKTGKLGETIQSWNCAVHAPTTLAAMITTLTATLPAGSEDPIHRTLDGLNSAYDDIGNCLP